MSVIFCLPRVAPAVDVGSGASTAEPLLIPDGPEFSETINIGDARIYFSIEAGSFDLTNQSLVDWVTRSAGIVASYYGSFPVDEAWISIDGTSGTRVMRGEAIPTAAGGFIDVTVGVTASRDALANDWILVHELIHLAFPKVNPRHHWLEEGLSVYVESIARATSGDLSADQVWGGFLNGMPNGVAQEGDKGLDHTPTWGRTYWGGALYCLLADIRIREQTGGRKSLRDALRGIVAAGYDMTTQASLREILMIADEAVGVRVMSDLYEEMRNQPLPNEVDSLWLKLGVSGRPGAVTFDNNAPLANTRRALTQSSK